jgi:hypothetical protein
MTQAHYGICKLRNCNILLLYRPQASGFGINKAYYNKIKIIPNVDSEKFVISFLMETLIFSLARHSE